MVQFLQRARARPLNQVFGGRVVQMQRPSMLVVCLAVLALGAVAPGRHLPCQAPTRERVQTQFGLEEPLQRPVVLPDSALRALRRDEYAAACVKQHPEVHDLGVWFTASEIDLNTDGRWDLVVQASDGAPLCLMGANIGPFWVLQNLGTNYRVVLRTHMLGIEVLPSKTRGFPDIESSAATAEDLLTTVYRFDGNAYRPRKWTRKPIGAWRAETVRFDRPSASTRRAAERPVAAERAQR